MRFLLVNVPKKMIEVPPKKNSSFRFRFIAKGEIEMRRFQGVNLIEGYLRFLILLMPAFQASTAACEVFSAQSPS